jgi:hypothetical protein
MRIAPIRTISKILTRGKVAMKCAALLKGTGSLLSSMKFMKRCKGRNIRRKRPASAITNFFEIDENRILFIEYEIFIVSLIPKARKLIKVKVIESELQF